MKKLYLNLAVVIFLLFLFSDTLYASKREMGRLIQVTTLEEDYQALVHLELMETAALCSEDIMQAFQNILCSSVRIQARGHYGSGSIYKMTENDIIIVTNRHVLDYFDEESYITFFDGRVAGGSVAAISDTADVGFIKIPVSEFSYQELLQYRNIRIREEKWKKLKKNDCFFMVDLATDRMNPTCYEGDVIEKEKYLQEFGKEMFYGNGYAKPGMSGSGIFDGCGYYIGMLSAGTNQGEIAAVPLPVIEEEYKKCN